MKEETYEEWEPKSSVRELESFVKGSVWEDILYVLSAQRNAVISKVLSETDLYAVARLQGEATMFEFMRDVPLLIKRYIEAGRTKQEVENERGREVR